MKLQCNFDALEALRVNMGAPMSDWRLDSDIRVKEKSDFLKELETKGIEVAYEEITITKDGLFKYKDESVIIYIKDHTTDKPKNHDLNFEDPKNLRKIHLCDCNTIHEMKKKKRFERYIASKRKGGHFEVDLPDPHGKNVIRKLLPCINCIKELNYENYESRKWHEKRTIVNEFDLNDFFKYCESKFSKTPLYTDKTVPSSGYAKPNSKPSNNIYERRGWKCGECEVYLGERVHRRHLHRHHKNGIKWDDKPSNLECLCIVCHAQQPMHAHMQVSDSDKQLIESLRRAQGLV